MNIDAKSKSGGSPNCSPAIPTEAESSSVGVMSAGERVPSEDGVL